MEHTFLTIHNLHPDANILYASDSIFEILGYSPQEVSGRSAFEYFHPEEIPYARSIHSRGVLLDKAAVLHYARLRSRDGRWVSTECVFSIVHDVLFACISIYRCDMKSERRALAAPQVRRLFSRSPRDPRYHMLEHLSSKFRLPPVEREPRAALILNRFTRTLTVMFATDSIASILGVPADQVQHKSFYECIRESCLDDAVRCLESAKANDSIAYLRFWSRDPRRPEDFEDEESNIDGESTLDATNLDGVARSEEPPYYSNQHTNSPSPDQNRSDRDSLAPNRQQRAESHRSSDSEGGGVKLDGAMDLDSRSNSSSYRRPGANAGAGPSVKAEPDTEMQDGFLSVEDTTSGESRTTSSNALGSNSRNSQAGGYETPPTPPSPQLVGTNTPRASRERSERSRPAPQLAPSVELEAVVSCTSDGLVVIIRRARPQIPDAHNPNIPSTNDRGVFAAPWAQQPFQAQYSHETFHNFQSPLAPQHMPLRSGVQAAGGPPMDQLMQSIRDVAVFAWALCGINGNIASYSHGQPSGEAQPPDGLPIWDPEGAETSYEGPWNQAAERWAREAQRQQPSFYQQDSISTDFSMEGTADYSSHGTGYQNHTTNGHGNSWLPQPSAYQQNQNAFAYNNHQSHGAQPNYSDNSSQQHPDHWNNGQHNGQHWPGNGQAPSSAEETRDHIHRWY
jgi:PAS domain S-box-containing protein